MRIAVGQIKQEANHFNPQLCTIEHFEANGLLYGDDVVRGYGPNSELGGAISELTKHGVELAPLMLARSVSYGPLTSDCFKRLKSDMLSRLRAALPVDGVFISFHGAMAAVDDDDPEGTILSEMRELVGPDVRIASSYDLHAHMSTAICEAADIVEGYRTYPHDDGFETGARAAAFLVRAIRGEIKPRLSLGLMNMLVPGTNQQTAFGPASLLWHEAKRRISDGDALSVSIFCGHSKLDVPDHGFAVVVLNDDRADAGLEIADDLCHRAWELRREFEVQTVPTDEAVSRALAVDRGPVVLVDLGDVPGGGGAGDSNAILKALLGAKVQDLPEPSQLIIVDAESAEACHRAGVGAQVNLKLGGKLQPDIGEPITIAGYVKSLHDGKFVYAMGNLKGAPGGMGLTAVVTIGSINVVVTSLPTYEYADEQYRAVGLDMGRCRITVARAGMNFKFAFQGTARHIILVDSPGPTGVDLRLLPFKRFTKPSWPFEQIDQPTIRKTVH